MENLHLLKDAWQYLREEKKNYIATSLRVEDRIVAVKMKVLNTGVLLILKRASYQGRLKDTAKTYSTVIRVKDLLSLEIMYYTPHLKDILKYCVNLQDFSLTDVTLDRELVRFILQSPLTNTCTFSRCKFEADALHYFFRSYFERTLKRNWIAETSLSDAEFEEIRTGSVNLSEFEAEKFPGLRVRLNFVLRITDDRRRGTSQLCFINCTLLVQPHKQRFSVFKNLDPEPLKAFQQVFQDLQHIVSPSAPWDDSRRGWSASSMRAKSSSFGSQATSVSHNRSM